MNARVSAIEARAAEHRVVIGAGPRLIHIWHAGERFALCGAQVRGAGALPLSAWGAAPAPEDREYCYNCGALARWNRLPVPIVAEPPPIVIGRSA